MSASPQLEDGHVRIATELLLALIRAGLTARQWPIVMVIARKTYGYQKKVDDIGLSQISELTGIAKPHVSVAVRELAARRIITRKVGAFGHILGINKNHTQWLPAGSKKSAAPGLSDDQEMDAEGVTESVTVTDSVTVTESVTEGLPNQYLGGYRIGKAGVTESVTTIDNPTKENHQKKESCAPHAERDSIGDLPAGKKQRRAMTGASQDLQDRFDRFYTVYPRKRSRKAAEKAFAKLNPDEQLLQAMIASIERAIKSDQWRKGFIPHPSTWINDGGWMDEIQTAYSSAELTVIQLFNDVLGEQLGTVSEDLFDVNRAAAIRDFMTFSEKPDFVARVFPWILKNADLPPHVGFDWLMSRVGFDKATGGQHTRKAA